MANLKAGCTNTTIDSNITGLRYVEEDCPAQLPASPVWKPLEPNSYSDFSAEYTSVMRETINPSRQVQKGTIADLDASFGINHDVTSDGMNDLLQGFFFASAREHASTKTVGGTPNTTISAIVADGITLAANVGFSVGDIVKLDGFTNSVNNTLAQISAITGGDIDFTAGSTVVAETPVPANARMRTVGKVWGAGGTIAVVAGQPTTLTLDTDATSGDFTLIPGEWIYLPKTGQMPSSVDAGGFVNNGGYARVLRVDNTTPTAKVIYFDKLSWTPVNEAAVGAIHILFSMTIRNEEDPNLIIQRSYQFERTLGRDADGVQSEYSIGAVADELALNLETAGILNADISYVAMRNEERTGAEGLKPGTRPDSTVSRKAINTATDIASISLSLLDDNSGLPVKQLFAYCTDATFNIANGVTARKAIANLGAIGMGVGNFLGTGSVTAYFTTVEAIRAIRQNKDVSIDMIVAAYNEAQVWDIPQLTLSNGAIAVEKDEAITIPLDINGVESKFGFTMQYSYFAYVPSN